MNMKKLLALIMALAMVLSLAACGSSSSDTTTDDTDTSAAAADDTTEESADDTSASTGGQKIGISMPTKSLERWNRDGTYLQEQFEAAGYEVEVTYADNDTDQQNNDIANLIADGVDILIIAAVDGDTLSQTLADAGDIPVIAYDRLIMNSDTIDYYVSFDNYQVGVLQGQYVIDTLGLDLNDTSVSYNIEFTAGPTSDNNAGYFFNGAMDTLQDYIDAGILVIQSGKTTFEQCATNEWSTDTAMENMQNTLASYYSDGTQLDVALCSNDSTALGVAQAISTDYAGSNTVIVTGQDGDIANLANIVDGLQTMTVYKNVSDEAGVTLVLAQEILEGNEPAEELLDSLDAEAAYDTESYDNGTGIIPSYLLVPWTVTVDNLEDLVSTGLYEWDGDYLVSATDE
ncbi:MAG: sugar-binding protein [Lachnospiraceae bacterium]|nr:sugar-binding protein [Lachnospiraceae bacterium]